MCKHCWYKQVFPGGPVQHSHCRMTLFCFYYKWAMNWSPLPDRDSGYESHIYAWNVTMKVQWVFGRQSSSLSHSTVTDWSHLLQAWGSNVRFSSSFLQKAVLRYYLLDFDVHYLSVARWRSITYFCSKWYSCMMSVIDKESPQQRNVTYYIKLCWKDAFIPVLVLDRHFISYMQVLIQNND